jgi:hypothetical protein
MSSGSACQGSGGAPVTGNVTISFANAKISKKFRSIVEAIGEQRMSDIAKAMSPIEKVISVIHPKFGLMLIDRLTWSDRSRLSP